MYMYGLSTKILWYISIVSSSLESKQILHRGIPRLSFWIQSEIVSEVGFIFLNMIVSFHGMFFQFSYIHSMNELFHKYVCTSKKSMWKLSSEKKCYPFGLFPLMATEKLLNECSTQWLEIICDCNMYSIQTENKEKCFGVFNHTNFAWLLYKQLM